MSSSGGQCELLEMIRNTAQFSKQTFDGTLTLSFGLKTETHTVYQKECQDFRNLELRMKAGMAMLELAV
jgi:hypothetical protein